MTNGPWKVQGALVMFCNALAMAKDLHTRCQSHAMCRTGFRHVPKCPKCEEQEPRISPDGASVRPRQPTGRTRPRPQCEGVGQNFPNESV